MAPAVDVDEVKRGVEAEKVRKYREMMRLSAEIGDLTTDGVDRRLNTALLRFKTMPVLDMLDYLKRKEGAANEDLDSVRINLGEEKEALRRYMAR